MVRVKIKTLLIIFFVSAASWAQPKLYIPEPTFDFGYMPEGTYVVHKFVIKNTGKDVLKIRRIRTTCSCTWAPIKTHIIKPGEQTELSLFFNSARYFHRTAKAAIIITNDPEAPAEKVMIIANMDTAKQTTVLVVPWKLDLGVGWKFKPQGTVKIKNMSHKPVTLKIIDYFDEALEEPVLSTSQLQPGTWTELKISVKKNAAKEHYIHASVTVSVLGQAGNEITRFTIPVCGGTE
ncbi:MAG TPA: DUF1573 domain-containing protein [candidate division Zixibacteria bacterium]|nr:DUF1573 domain-containing protein [candidate division Zixibacteria bacterium]